MFKHSQLLFTLPALLVTAGLSAQTSTRGDDYWRSFGNSDVRATLSAEAYEGYDSNTGWVNLEARATGRAFGRFAELGFARSYADQDVGGAGEAGVTLRLAGYTVANPRYTSSRSFNWLNLNLSAFGLRPSSTFVIAGIPVTVYVDAGVQAYANGNVTLASSNGTAMLSTRARILAWGSAGAMVGLDGFGAGVEFQMRLADTELNIQGGARPGQHLGTGMLYVMPLNLRLVAFAEFMWIRLGQITIVSRSVNPYIDQLF